MAYIYQIENDINHKKYIGKTEFSLEKRLKEHIRDSQKNNYINRPLYKAMRKYGTTHFHISLLEETNCPNEREIYWIEKLATFKNGYNATHGGDGTRYLDYELIYKTYQQVQNIEKTAQICKVNRTSVTKILKSKQVDIQSSKQVSQKLLGKPIGMYKNNQLIATFTSLREAGRYIIQYQHKKNEKNIAASIGRCANGKRNTVYGYQWKYL